MVKYKTVVRKVKVDIESGASGKWIKQNFKDLVACFEQLIYSDKKEFALLIYQYENKDKKSGVSIERMLKILQKHNYKIQIITWKL